MDVVGLLPLNNRLTTFSPALEWLEVVMPVVMTLQGVLVSKALPADLALEIIRNFQQSSQLDN